MRKTVSPANIPDPMAPTGSTTPAGVPMPPHAQVPQVPQVPQVSPSSSPVQIPALSVPPIPSQHTTTPHPQSADTAVREKSPLRIKTPGVSTATAPASTPQNDMQNQPAQSFQSAQRGAHPAAVARKQRAAIAQGKQVSNQAKQPSSRLARMYERQDMDPLDRECPDVPLSTVRKTDNDEPESNKKKKKKKNPLVRVIFWLALLVLIGSLGVLGYLVYTYWDAEEQYNQITERAFGEPDDDATLADLVVDWDALREINPDVVGWIYIPGTAVNYPIAHKDGDSEYYLHHNFSLEEGAQFGAEFGSIMLSGDNKADFSDEVNILYGHHMRDGSMFAQFAEFRESEEFNKHRHIYLLTPEGNYRLTTFGVEHVPMTYGTIATPNYQTDEEFNEFKQWLIDNSIVNADPNTDDRVPDAAKLFGFSTCDGADDTWRYITFATVSEFVPADMIGTGEYKGRKVKDKTIDKVENAVEDRTEDLAENSES